jgi:hypothetical protein
MVFQWTFSGVTYVVAIATGVDGWTLIDQAPAGADDVILRAADTYVTALGGGTTFLRRGDYEIRNTLAITTGNSLKGEQWVRARLTSYNVDTITLSGTSTLCDLTVLCNSSTFTSAGITLQGAYNKIERVRVYRDPIKNYGGTAVKLQGQAQLNTLRDLHITQQFTNGVLLSSDSSSNYVNGNSFFNIHVLGAVYGYIMTIAGTGIIQSNNFVVCWYHYVVGGLDAFTIDDSGNQFTNCWASDVPNTQHAARLLATSSYTVFQSGYFGVGLVQNLGTDNEFHDVIGYVTENTVLSPAFAIDGVALITVTIPHGLSITPTIQDCTLTVLEDTNVDDWGYNLLKVDNVGAANVVAKINVTVASATGGATAKLSLRIGKA